MKERNERLKRLLETNKKPVEKIVEKIKKVHVMVESPKPASYDAFVQVDLDKENAEQLVKSVSRQCKKVINLVAKWFVLFLGIPFTPDTRFD